MRIFITGATDGIGLETARSLKSLGHEVIIHGRSQDKLDKVSSELDVKYYRADFSDLSQVRRLADEVSSDYSSIDVLINNAGIFKTADPRTTDGYDVRYVVNTFAPYILSVKLLPLLEGENY